MHDEAPPTVLSTDPPSHGDEEDDPSVLDSRVDALLARVAHISAAPLNAAVTLPNDTVPGQPRGRADQPNVPAPGDVVDDKYEVQATLGAGAMGVVFAARNTRTGREVALKYMLGDGRLSRGERRAHVERFLREALTVGRVRDPHVVDIYDVGGDLDAPFLVMERLYGESLRKRLMRGALHEGELLRIAIEAARGVAAAHRQGVVHRDLKPDNLFLAQLAQGGVITKVLDFGVSRVIDPQGTSTTLTRVGVVVGTPAYMPLEQLRAEGPVDARVDVYAMGAIMYEALAGRRPYPGRTLKDVLVGIERGAPPSLSQLAPRVSPWLNAVIVRCLAREPAQRFADASELLATLEAGARRQRLRRQVRVWSVGLAALLGLVALALWMLQPMAPSKELRAQPTRAPTIQRSPAGGHVDAPAQAAPVPRAVQVQERAPTAAPSPPPAPAPAPAVVPPTPAPAGRTGGSEREPALRHARKLRADEF